MTAVESSTAASLLDIDNRTVRVTRFDDRAARIKHEERLTLPELMEMVLAATAEAKALLPWLKLAAFGDSRTDKGSLRHDANVLAISGVELDYDGEQVTFDQAVATAKSAGLRALIYTSPSHREGKPRWRVLLPTSEELPPGERAALVDRAQNLFGCIFARESATLSQAYFYGSVRSNPDHHAEVLDGAFIDRRDDLDAADASAEAGRFDERAALERIAAGEEYHESCVALLGKWAASGVPVEDAKTRLCEVFDSVPVSRRDGRWRDRRDDINRCAEGIYAKEARKFPAPHAPEPRWPSPLGESAYHGLAGEFVRAIAPHTEADPVALLAQVLAAFGNCIGRGAHFKVEGDEHHANLFVALVGETSKARKGTSWGRVRELFSALEDDWAAKRVFSGMSSGEGLIWQVRDPITTSERDKKTGEVTEAVVDEGVSDKRLLVQESEFAAALRVMMRDGNTLSRIIRDAWDRGNLASMTKNSPARATGAHVSIIGHCTAEELRRYLDVTEVANGFANRFIFFCVRRSNVLPFGGDPRALREAMIPLEAKLRRAQTRAAAADEDADGFRGAARQLIWADDARALWASEYGALSDGRPGMLGAVTGRAEAQVVRLALTYALLDEAGIIEQPHLEAALALWRYAEASAAYVFGEALGDPVADVILPALRAAAGGLTRSEVRALFGGHQSSANIDRGLGALARRGLAAEETRQTRGRPTTIWRALR